MINKSFNFSELSNLLEYSTVDTSTGEKLNKSIESLDCENLCMITSTFLENSFSHEKDDRSANIYSKENRDIYDVFYIKKCSSLQLDKYIERIMKHGQVENGTLIYAMALINKFLLKNNNFIRLCALNINLIILSSIICALKLLEDKIFLNSFYAKVGGISLEKLNLIERSFLALIDFESVIREETYLKYNDFFLSCSL